MLAQQRQAVILEQIRLNGGVRVSELTDVLGVSDMTVRRDLETLAARGMLDEGWAATQASKWRWSAESPLTNAS